MAVQMHKVVVVKYFGLISVRTLPTVCGQIFNRNFSRRKVQKLRGQSQYISKNVRALQYWRWACGTCCKQYHMLFYIQMAVVSTAIFFLFSPSFPFFLEIKVQIYIYFHNKCQYINQFPPEP